MRWLAFALAAFVSVVAARAPAAGDFIQPFDPAPPDVPAAAQQEPPQPPDIELWLGERVGRYGDFEFAILGGRPGYPTPKGAFAIEWKNRNHYSKQWNAPMPYAMFFSGGSAIHEGSLGTMSHGCVHVSESAAKRLFSECPEKRTRVFVYP